MSKDSGKKRRGKLTPRLLAGKIRQIRLNLGLTQAQIWLIVNPEQAAHNRSRISHFEREERIPSLRETWNYARLCGIPVEVLADDALELEDGQTRGLADLRKESAKEYHPAISNCASENITGIAAEVFAAPEHSASAAGKTPEAADGQA